MALVKCKECGSDVSNKAASCPRCGAKRPKQTAATTWFVGSLLAFVIGGSIYKSNRASVDYQTTASQAASSRLVPIAQTEAEKDAAREKRLQDIKTSCTVGLNDLLRDAKALLASGDSAMASARLTLCSGVSTDKDFLALYQAAERHRAEKITKLERDEKARKRKEGVSVGMSKEDVLASSWGKPQKVNATTTAFGTREQWVYGGHSYLYFTGNVLTTIQN